MANDFFSPLLSDVYGLFGGGHGMTEGPPLELEQGPSASALEQFSKLEPVMRGLLLPFFKAAKKREHEIVLLPTLYGLDEYLEPAAARMSETSIEQMGGVAAALKRSPAFPAHHEADETKTATTGLLYHFRVAYYDANMRQTLARKDVRPDRWLDLAHLAHRYGLRPGAFLPEADVALFQHPEPKPTPSRNEGLIEGAKIKATATLDPDTAVKFATDLIKKYDACPLTAYPDPITGNAPWIVGYGASGPSIAQQTLWTVGQADADLDTRAKNYLATIFKLVKVPLPSTSFGALVSIAYNIGLPALKKSTLLKQVNSGKFAEVPKEFSQWIKVEGVVVPRLKTRRKEEAELFMEGLPVSKPKEKPATDPKAKTDPKPKPGPTPPKPPEPHKTDPKPKPPGPTPGPIDKKKEPINPKPVAPEPVVHKTDPKPGPTPPKPGPTPAPAPAGGKKYSCKKGDSLPGIAHNFYQAGDFWYLLWKYNKGVIGKDWTKVERGMELFIPDMKTLKKEEIMESKSMQSKYKNPPR